MTRRMEVSGDLVALLVFKTSAGLKKVPGGFASHPPPSVTAGCVGAGTTAVPAVEHIPRINLGNLGTTGETPVAPRGPNATGPVGHGSAMNG